MFFCCIIRVDVVGTEDTELCSECSGNSKKRIRDDKQILWWIGKWQRPNAGKKSVWFGGDFDFFVYAYLYKKYIFLIFKNVIYTYKNLYLY